MKLPRSRLARRSITSDEGNSVPSAMPRCCSTGTRLYTNLNTVAYIDEARLLEDAREIDSARARGAQLGPLAGLPMMLKDNINTVGFPTTAGTAFLKDYRPKINAPLADLLFKQGAILFAKSNMRCLCRVHTR